jgi:hypothetical protein
MRPVKEGRPIRPHYPRVVQVCGQRFKSARERESAGDRKCALEYSRNQYSTEDRSTIVASRPKSFSGSQFKHQEVARGERVKSAHPQRPLAC